MTTKIYDIRAGVDHRAGLESLDEAAKYLLELGDDRLADEVLTVLESVKSEIDLNAVSEELNRELPKLIAKVQKDLADNPIDFDETR